MLENLLQIDGNILLFIQENLRFDFLNYIMKFITSLGDVGRIWVIFSAIMLISKKTRLIGVLGFITLIIDVAVINVFIKNIVDRPRPFDEISNLIPLIERPTDSSFPSSHTGSSIAVSLLYLKLLPDKEGIPYVVLAVLISFSRMYVGVHYPSDVLVGALIGVMIFVFVLFLEKPVKAVMDKIGILNWGGF